MGRIRGITVILYEKVQTGLDGFNKPVYEEIPVEIDNVLVGEPQHSEVLSQTDLTGSKAVYTLGIPKGDAHNWENAKVRFFDQDWKTFGIPVEGIDELIPGDWNKKVQVERYE